MAVSPAAGWCGSTAVWAPLAQPPRLLGMVGCGRGQVDGSGGEEETLGCLMRIIQGWALAKVIGKIKKRKRANTSQPE